jgi:hypothetical protein
MSAMNDDDRETASQQVQQPEEADEIIFSLKAQLAERKDKPPIGGNRQNFKSWPTRPDVCDCFRLSLRRRSLVEFRLKLRRNSTAPRKRCGTVPHPCRMERQVIAEWTRITERVSRQVDAKPLRPEDGRTAPSLNDFRRKLRRNGMCYGKGASVS